MNKGILYVVATPIGNLDDITLRAIKILQEVDLIAAEDTRHTLKLLNHLDISKPLISYHRHNEEVKSDILIEKLKEAKVIGANDNENEYYVIDLSALEGLTLNFGREYETIKNMGTITQDKQTQVNSLKDIYIINKTWSHQNQVQGY